jgi:hypothetical protein
MAFEVPSRVREPAPPVEPPGFDRNKHEAQRQVGRFMHHANLCWCGSPEDFLRLVLAQLERFDADGAKADDVDRVLAEPLNLTFAMMLDSWELTEHGSSLYGAWLTRAGLRLRAALRILDLGDADRSSVDLDELLPSYEGGWYAREAAVNPQWRQGARYVELGEWETES